MDFLVKPVVLYLTTRTFVLFNGRNQTPYQMSPVSFRSFKKDEIKTTNL